MDPPSKRRRLAPKVPDPPPPVQQFPPDQQAPPTQHYPVQEPAPVAERHDFESFARHLQDAAMLIYHQTQKSPYTSVSVLLLRWEEDTSVEQDLATLEKVFRERYNYHTDTWSIPTVPNPSIKLGVQMASFLEHARPDHLLIIYYAGYGYVGADNQLYWACNAREDASKLKWDGVRCLFEDAQSDILLLLDTCAVRDTPMAGSHGVKQAIAAYSPEQKGQESLLRSFTASLADSLTKLSPSRFSVQRLYEEIVAQRQQELHAKLTNGASKAPPPPDKMPIFFTLTPFKGQNLSLAPMPHNVAPTQSPQPAADVDGHNSKSAKQDSLLGPGPVVDLTFDEARVLVCTTFVGDASPDMSFFTHWLQNTPPIASKIAMEGMFLGPPTMLLISMPMSIWNVVQHDKVCCFLGYINSHNMIDLYKRLVGSTPISSATSKDVEDGRILLEAREAAASSPLKRRIDPVPHVAVHPEIPVRPEVAPRNPLPNSAPDSSVLNRTTVVPKDEVEDSAEMQEAAEQLKALSHLRHLSDEAARAADGHGIGGPDDRLEENVDDVNDLAPDESHQTIDFGTPTTKPKPARRSLQKATPKQETRCNMCSHSPFKDSSSLRKHIAAAHTRPFPCAFSFAGCTSTFGSKNEWKRHIASQHLCLQYYRCSSCPQSTAEGKGNEFNRKDLFTQHLRRMHAPFQIKKAITKSDSKLQVEWETHVKEMQQSCIVTRRSPPQRAACPKPDCQYIFEGPTSWDEWTEHVGRHMEKGEGARLGVDRLLAKWALDEGIIERKDDGEYKLCPQNGSNGASAERDTNLNSSFISDSGKQDEENDPNSIVVATTTQVDDKMDTDE
ncbi:Zinc finger and BTB domain-containing protein 11 [Pleurostoma richardsiae]|uniref:Zinc finger and BTB domain-containing protein 11 n=1 Tax=Pleurostoma richardsiae TaxID=41990 RepID=A0AA38RVJ7_9PEZI|nr:Zinc finger and BTB domain-containing protein 11 [Pleurostoma richardsiae]